MSKQEQIQKIRNACIEANPDIKKLEFGCKALYHDGKTIMKWIHYGPDFNNFDGPDVHFFIKPDGTRLLLPNSGIEGYEIIGRDIRLADVLYTMQNPCIMVNKNGDICEVGEKIARLGKWNLLKDNLTEQSDETIEFVFNLLK